MATQTSARSSSGSKVSSTENVIEALEDKLAPKLEEAKEKLSDLNTQAVDFIQKNPLVSVVGALGVGFIIGRLASR